MQKIKEKLEKQLKIESESIELYNSFLEATDDENIKLRVTRIRDNEIDHVELVKEMISIIGKYSDMEESPVEEHKKDIDTKGFIDDYGTLHLKLNVDQYAKVMTDIVGQIKLPCIYLSYNKLSRYIKKQLHEHGIDISKIRFINGIHDPQTDDEDSFVAPEALTEISIKIEEKKFDDKRQYIIIDSVSAFSIYHDSNTILKFISFMNSKMDENTGIIWVSLKSENDELSERISQVCNKTIEL